jgi:hypothetical protein
MHKLSEGRREVFLSPIMTLDRPQPRMNAWD